MKLLEFLEGDRTRLVEYTSMSFRDYKEILADYQIICGFEMEFAYRDYSNEHYNIEQSDDPYSVDELKYDHVSQIVAQAAEEFEEATGIQIGRRRGKRTSIKNSKRWYIEPDFSIDDHPVGGTEQRVDPDIFGIELVSPAEPLAQTIQRVEKSLTWLTNAKNYFTNGKTGFHVRMSYIDTDYTRKNVDPLKLIMFLGEEKALQDFRRKGNQYSKSQLTFLRRMIQAGFPQFSQNESQINAVLSILNSFLDVKNKANRVNLKKLQRFGYIEFRFMGNTNYDRSFDKIRAYMIHLGYLLKLACDPKAYREEYLKKVYQFIQKAVEGPKLAAQAPVYPTVKGPQRSMVPQVTPKIP